MKKPKLGLLLFLIFIGMADLGKATAAYAQDNPMRKDAVERLADLHKAKNALDAAKADLVAAKEELALVQQRPHAPGEVQAFQARMDKDQSTIQSSVTEIVGDAQFLETRWNLLTQEEKDFVSSVQKNLD